MNKCLCGIYASPCPYCKELNEKLKSVERALKHSEILSEIRMSLKTKDGTEIVIDCDSGMLQIETTCDKYYGKSSTIKVQCFPSHKTKELFRIQVV
jgi:hypothetical protein